MKVVHIESGLGNQMLDYADYLAIRLCNPSDECYIETIIYDIKESHDTINMWNGYELERVFGIKEPNISEHFTQDQWQRIIKRVADSGFWLDNWRYSNAINDAFAAEGLLLVNVNTRRPLKETEKFTRSSIYNCRVAFVNTKVGYNLKRILFKIFRYKIEYSESVVNSLFYTKHENIYGGHLLKFNKKGNQIERIEKQIREKFIFPEFSDENNLRCIELIKKTNSISIHARRGDMLTHNGKYYKYGYFKRAVKYIRKSVENPVFFIFCDSESVEWCKKNYSIFGLNKMKDIIHFVDWNRGADSYKDMQLMSHCKHNIITNSTFGWWASFLNTNPNKITCSPDIRINTTNSF